MTQDVKYKGYSASPSDYECLDGEMADVVNLIPEGGALKIIEQPKEVFTYLEHDILFVHKTDVYTHYIGKGDTNKLYWLQEGEEQSAALIHGFGDSNILQVTAVGNTLVILTDGGVEYALWEQKNGAYTFLGVIPECPISFGLVGESRYYSKLKYENGSSENGKFTINYSHSISNAYDIFDEENKRSITNQALAKVNRFVEEISAGDNRFMFPFFVRYGYRLYDESVTYISAPILMLPCTYTNPYVLCDYGESSTKADIFAIAAQLDYKALISESEKAALGKWKDVVKSVDIFVSAPIYTYDQSGFCESFNGGTIGRFVGKFKKGENDAISSYYQGWDIEKLYGYENGSVGFTQWKLKLPEFSSTELDKKVRECSTFFLLSSIEINDLKRDERVAVPFEDGVLGSLSARETMPDDYQSHDKLYAKRAFGYNNRINLSNVKRKLFNGFDLASMIPYINGRQTLTQSGSVGLTLSDSGGTYKISTFTKVKSDNGEVYVKKESNTELSAYIEDIYYLYYPDTSASEMYLVSNDSTSQSDGKVLLQAHPFLNGCCVFKGLRGVQMFKGVQETPPDQSEDAFVTTPNKIYTSEINNPFYYPLLGINTVGSGEVLGISTAAKALSQGQFGQFPLYAFTTEGVWALEVASNGSYSAKQPITRDVCINPDSITQIDSAVLFATDRGIMLLSGSQTTCLTEILDSKDAFSIHDLPQGEDLAGISFGNYNEGVFKRVPFKEYLTNCGMLYDYAHQRIIVYNPTRKYAYMYSLESKQWGLIINGISHTVPSYPNALAMSHLTGGYRVLWDFSKETNVTKDSGLLVTRPLKLGAQDVLKTVDCIIQRGRFKKGHVQTALYGSRDLENWFLVASSTDHYLRGFRGTAFKYFRVAVLCELEPHESISGCTVQFESKQTNQPR